MLAARLHVCPTQLEAEGPEVIATMLDLLTPPSTMDDDVDALWPEEARA